MEGCESLDSKMADLQALRCESPAVMDQDDEDEVEELRNSLREAVQDPSVKPKLQCLMVDPSFSMVTVQSEDSGIVWETASSRCSTPWASETSSISEGYSMDGSGTQGQITIIFDEEQIIRRRIRSGGRSSRLSDRLRRPGSSRSGSALGVERLEMAEVSVPNCKQEKTQGEPDLEEIKDKDQQLFSLISEGYEILNIRVPSKLPTVDEEESTELEDNLSYLDKTPGIKSKKDSSPSKSQDLSEGVEVEIVENKEAAEQDSTDSAIGDAKTKRYSIGDMDYFEKFTLVDVVVPSQQAPESQLEVNVPAAKPQEDEEMPGQETSTNSPTASDESFVFVTDVEMAGDHLDEVFYGNGAHEASDNALQRREEAETESVEKIRVRRASQRSLKDNGSVLFCSEQTVLTPIFLSPGPPKIIDQILLDEPTAMSYMYSDLYEDAVGERTTSDGDRSEVEHVASEKIFKRRLSDSEEADGYLEMFTLRDETSMVEVQPEMNSVEDEDEREGRRLWSQNVFEMTGCLTRVKEEVKEKGQVKNEEARREEECAVKRDLQSTKDKVKEEENVVTQMKVNETEPSVVSPIRKRPVELTETPEEKETIKDMEVKQEVKKVQSEPFGSGSNKTESLPETQEVEVKVAEMGESKEQQKEVLHVPGPEPQVESQLHEASNKVEAVVQAKEETSTMIVPDVVIKPEAKGDIVDIAQVPARNEEAPDKAERVVVEIKESVTEEAEIVAAVQKVDKADEITKAQVVVTGGVEVPEALTQETVEAEKPNDEPLSGEIDSALIEMDEPAQLIIDSKAAVQAVVGVVEEALDRTEIQVLSSKANSIDRPEVMAVKHKPDVETEIETEVEQPEVEVEAKARLDWTLTEISATDQSQPKLKEESVIIKELDKKELPSEVDITKISSIITHDTVNVGDDFVLLVPKGKAVEMDIEIGRLSERVEKSDAEGLPEAESTCDNLLTPPVCPASPQPEPEPILKHAEPEIQPDQVSEEKVLPVKVLGRHSPSPPVAVEEVDVEEEKEADEDLEEESGVLSRLRSFTPLEDLSGLQREEVSSATEVSPATDMHADVVEPETDRATDIPETQKDGADQEMQQPTEDALPQAELHREIVEETDQTAEELEYEIITKQEAREIPAPEEKPDVEVPLLQSEDKEKTETEKQDMEIRMEERELELLPGEEPIEAEYDIIDTEDESQARAAAELQGMDWFCLACGCLLSEEACASGEHQDHERISVDRAYEDIKEKLSDWISELQARSENIEDLVSELELAYNSVEDQCAEMEESMQSQNEEMIALVMEQYNGMSLGMEEEKKAKLEQLYDQIVSSQENIDSAKGILETTAREAETEARSPEDIEKRLKAALKSTMSLELGPKGLLVFENYAKGNNSSAHLKQRKGIPVPLKPTLQPQEPGSATSTSVTVYWNVNPGDVIDCFQVYCVEDPQGAVSEEYRVTVKESYCVLEELKPNRTYRVWVMAVNYSGCSLPSERLAFSTAPSVPVIDPANCSVLWGSATLRWASDHLSPDCSYTLEYCRQYELEGEGLRSISGIGGAEQKVLLQPNENYLFYIKAVNEAGGSEQSEAALISTKGTRFHLSKASAHPLLELSEDQTTVRYDQSTHDNTQSTGPECPTILGELLPARGRYYWETVVAGCAAYRVGVAYATANRSSPLGQNSKSWCLQCTPTESSCGYRLLHNGVTSDVLVIEIPERVGTLMDYQHGRLSFYNAQSGQLLGSLSHRFTQPCHPTLGLEQPGSLAVSMALEVPEFANHS